MQFFHEMRDFFNFIRSMLCTHLLQMGVRVVNIVSALLIFSASTSSAGADDAIDLIRRLHLEQKPVHSIQITNTSFANGDISRLFQIHSSLTDIDDWNEFLDRNLTASGILEALAQYNETFGTKYRIEDTTTRFLFYDIRLVEFPPNIEEILAEGGDVEIYLDSSNSQAFHALSKRQMRDKGWSDNQIANYLEQYDKNKNGRVDKKDEAEINAVRYLGTQIFSRLKSLEDRYPNKLKLTALPEMLVPEKGQLYPPIMHAKGVYTWITKTGDPIRSAEMNSNLTPNEMMGRLVPSRENEDNYLSGRKPKLLPQAEPYPQVALQLGPELDVVIRDVIEFDNQILEKIITEGRFKTPQTSLPTTIRYTDSDGEHIDVRVHRSYGDRKTTTPWDPMSRFLSDKNNIIESIQSAQFVFSNRNLMNALIGALEDPLNFNDSSVPADEKVNVVINSDHGLQTWSALWRVFSSIPHTLYKNTSGFEKGLLTKVKGPEIRRKRKFQLSSSLLDNAFQTYWSKMQFNLPDNSDLSNFEGNIAPSKNHSKVMAIKYKNQFNGEVRYRLYVTSANASQNAGVGTYEHTIEIDTSSSQLFQSVRSHVSGLKKHRRTTGFFGTYARLVLYSLYSNPEKILQNIDAFKFRFPIEWDQTTIEEFQTAYLKYDLSSILDFLTTLNKKRAKSKFNEHGERLLKDLLDLKKVKDTFTDDEFYQLWRLSLLDSSENSEALRKYVYSELGLRKPIQTPPNICVELLKDIGQGESL